MTEYEENQDELKNLNWTDEEEHALQLELDSTYEAKKHLWERFFGYFSPILENNHIIAIPTLKKVVLVQDWHVIDFLVE